MSIENKVPMSDFTEVTDIADTARIIGLQDNENIKIPLQSFIAKNLETLNERVVLKEEINKPDGVTGFEPIGKVEYKNLQSVSGDEVFNFLDIKKTYPDSFNFFNNAKIYEKWYFNNSNKLIYLQAISSNWRVAIVKVTPGDKLYITNLGSQNAIVTFSKTIDFLDNNITSEYESDESNFIPINGVIKIRPVNKELELIVPQGTLSMILQISSDFDAKPVEQFYSNLSISKEKGGNENYSYIDMMNGSKVGLPIIVEENKINVNITSSNIIINCNDITTTLRNNDNDVIDLTNIKISNIDFKNITDEAPPFYSKEDILIGGNHGLPVSRIKANDFAKIIVGSEYQDENNNTFLCIESTSNYIDMLPINVYDVAVKSYLVVDSENILITNVSKSQNKELVRKKIDRSILIDGEVKTNGIYNCNEFCINESIYMIGRLQIIDFIKTNKSSWKNNLQNIPDYVIAENVHKVDEYGSYTVDVSYIFMQDVNVTELVGVMSQTLLPTNGDMKYKVGATNEISGLDFNTGVLSNSFTQRMPFTKSSFLIENQGDRIIQYNNLGAYVVGVSRIEEFLNSNNNFDETAPYISIATTKKIYNLILSKRDGKLFKKGDVFSYSTYKTPIKISDIIKHQNKEFQYIENISNNGIFNSEQNITDIIDSYNMEVSSLKVISFNNKGFLIHK